MWAVKDERDPDKPALSVKDMDVHVPYRNSEEWEISTLFPTL